MQRIITISTLGKRGRFGNQLFQYAFAKAYAERHDCILQTPLWIGQKLFKNIDDPIINVTLPRFDCERVIPAGQINIDLYGHFQNSQCLDIMSRSWLKQLYEFKDIWKHKFTKSSYYIAAHLRRGDYLKLSNVYCIIKEESVYRACEKFGYDKNKLIIISEENCKKYNDLDEDMQFLPDFMILMNADVLFRSNSTFSWWAGVLSNGDIYCPVVSSKTGWNDVEYIKGNYAKFLDTKNTIYKTIHNDLILKDN